MTFLIFLSVLQAIIALKFFKTVGLLRAGAIPHSEGLWLASSTFLAGVLNGFPVLDDMIVSSAFNNGIPISPQANYLPLWALGIGGAISTITFARCLYLKRGTLTTDLSTAAANACGLMLGAYLLFVVADQVAFFAPNREDAGMVNLGLLQELGGVSDVQCDSSLLVVSGLHSDTVAYRCPLEAGAVMGRFSGTPIVPWPTYTEGTSRQLSRVVKDMERQAVAPKEATGH